MKPGVIATALLIAAVLGYFVFPIAFALPVILVFGNTPPPPVKEAVRLFFKPIIFLGDLFPAYRQYLRKQEHLVGSP